ncbi:MAG: PEGA domain-containing protein, partial [Myxococcales bacterium]|nr:PEGA domain-containing protein [Myxococcales bacterium]
PLLTRIGYQSPEAAAGKPVDARSDIFSLGVVLYEFTARKRLFRGLNAEATRKKLLEADVPAPSQTLASYPAALERIVLKALSLDPEDRHSNAHQLRDDLLLFLEGEDAAVEPSELATYMSALFPDQVRKMAPILGEDYTTPGPEAAEAGKPTVTAIEAPAPAGAGPAEDAAELEEELDVAELEPEPEPVVPVLPKTPSASPTPVKTADPEPVANTRVPEPTPQPDSGPSVSDEPSATAIPAAKIPAAKPAAKPAEDGERRSKQVTSVSHELRKGLPDQFEKTAERSSQMTKVLAVLLVLFVGGIIWFGTNYQWPWEGQLNDRADLGPTQPREPRQPPPTVPLTLSTEPAGAAVSVNGVIHEGVTPTEIQVLPDLPNTIVLYMSGYHTQVHDEQVSDTSQGLSYTLDPVTMPEGWTPPPVDPNTPPPADGRDPNVWTPPRGRLNVNTTPPGATIFLNGVEQCVSPCEFETDAEEELHVTARKLNYMDTVSWTIVPFWDDERDTRYLTLTLRERGDYPQVYARFSLESSPTQAAVRVNGETLGATPVGLDRFIDEVHRVEISDPLRRPWVRTFYPSVGRF